MINERDKFKLYPSKLLKFENSRNQEKNSWTRKNVIFNHHFLTMSLKRKYNQVDVQTQRAIADDYQSGVRGSGYKALADKYRLPLGIVRNIIKRARDNKGEPVTERGHKRRKLNTKDETKLLETLRRNPSATNRQLMSAVRNKIKPQTVSDYLARQNPPVTTKKPINQEPKEQCDEWKEECHQYLRQIKRVPLKRRVYADETSIWDNEAPKRVRAPRGEKVYRFKARHGKKRTLHVFANQSGVLYWSLRESNAKDTEVQKVALSAIKKIEKGNILIWDRLGRSGRSKTPNKQHYNPKVAKAAAKRGVDIKFLPPLGKYFNPLELLFNDFKQHHLWPKGPGKSRSQLLAIIRKYMKEEAPKNLYGFFRERANGREAKREGLLG